MQREIKYRCWYNNQMYKVKSIDFNNKLINLNGADIIDFEEGILMQYTGLKDKNGVEIYENDIIQHKTIYSDEIGKDIVFFNEDYGTFEVAINGNKNESEVLGFYLSELSVDTKYEVIGNLCDKECEK